MGKYRNPPIVEALIDITINSACTIDEELINKYHETIKNVFPKKESQFGPNISINIAKSKEVKMNIENKIKSYKFISNSNDFVIQLIDNRVIFSDLTRPYPGWDDFIKKVEKRWNEFSLIFKPVSINRIGLRYINKIDCNNNELNEYMNIKSMISLPDNRNIGITNAIQRFSVMEIEKKEFGIINSVINPQEQKIEIIFDIDVFEMDNISNDWQLIVNKLESLRKFKNEIFETNITDKAREAFR